MAYRSVPRPSSPLSAKASTRYPYDTSSLSLSMARAGIRDQTAAIRTEFRSPISGPAIPARPIGPPRGATKRPLLHMSETGCGQATRHRCSTPPPRTWWTEAEKRNTIRLDRTPAPCGTEPDDRTHSLFTMSKNWLARASQSAGRTSFGGEFLWADDPENQGSGISTAPAPSLASGEPVEPDGIEPTTSCLQSTRSPN